MPMEFLDRLVVVYGAPMDTKDPRGFLTEYAKALNVFSREVLDAACDQMLNQRKYKSWPSIGECVTFCETARASKEQLQKSEKLAALRRHSSDPDLDALHDSEIKKILRGKGSEWTQRACREGWIVGLYDFVRDKHRIPVADERAELRKSAELVQKAATGEEHLGIMHGGLVKLANAMLARRERLLEEMAE